MKTIKNIVVVLLLPVLISTGSSFARELIPSGLRVPKVTTEERDQIPVGDPQSKGIIIFNTDNNCQEFWNGTSWTSLCGVVNPVVEIPGNACGRIRVFGRYFLNAPLDYTHFITLPVKVTQIGTFTISARSGNGYFFHTSGVFEELGVYELVLNGMGTPREVGIDNLVFTCNGVEFATFCDISIDVQQLIMAYRVDCLGIRVEGVYHANRPMDEDNHVVVPVEVLAPGLAAIRTDHQNGLRFVGSQLFTEIGPAEIILYATGSPIQEGTFRFDFTTDGDIRTICSFIVECISTLGTYEDPACSCLAIYRERPFAPNGEYWLQDCRGFVDGGDSDDDIVVERIRTFCDIAGGGWTLVWSYSEYTARNLYTQGSGASNSMRVNPSYWHFTFDRPRPARRVDYDITCDDPTNFQINYYDFRLRQQAWEFLSSDLNNQRMKARITVNPTDMRDQWALNNFAILSSTNRRQNPFVIEPTNTWGTANVPSAGRIFGKRWEVRPGGGWDEVSGTRRLRTRNSTSSTSGGFLWEWDRRGSDTPFEVRPNLGGRNNTMVMSVLDYTFGNFNATMPNHHFGRCITGPGIDGDICFTVQTCSPSNLIPHSFNGGEGRILQWFVK
jgi:hypothetical protein